MICVVTDKKTKCQLDVTLGIIYFSPSLPRHIANATNVSKKEGWLVTEVGPEWALWLSVQGSLHNTVLFPGIWQ